MSIIYPIAAPAMPPGPKQIVLAQNFAVAENDSPFTGQAQVYEHQASWWTLKVDMPYLTRAQAAPWLAFLAALNGKSGIFLFGDPTISGALGTVAAGSPYLAPLVGGSGQTGKTLLLWDFAGTLLAGDYLQCGSENRALFSQAFDNAVWTYTNCTRPTADTIVDPTGATTAEALIATGANALCAQQLPAGSFVPGQTYTFSVYLKAPGGARNLTIMIADPLFNVAANCALTTSWQRFSVVYTCASGLFPTVYVGQAPNYLPNGIEIDAWGAQVELGAVPSNQLSAFGQGAWPYYITTSTAQPSLRRLYMCASGPVTGPGAGVFSNAQPVEIFPRLRESPLSNTVLPVVNPQGQFRLDSNQQPWTVDGAGHYAISFSAREAF